MQQLGGGVVGLGLVERVGLVQQFGGAVVGLGLVEWVGLVQQFIRAMVHVLRLMEEFSGGVVRLNLMQQLRGRLEGLDFVHLVKNLIWCGVVGVLHMLKDLQSHQITFILTCSL